MLAYDLYLGNKHSNANITRGFEKPIKKIFVQNGEITIDPTTLEEYGSETNQRYRFLQEPLAMPLNTSDASLLNLPDMRTSTNQANPYIEIRGSLRPGSIIHLEISRKSNDRENVFAAALDILNDSISIDAEKDIPLRIEHKNYYFSAKDGENENKRKTVYEMYKEAGILSKNGTFFADVFSQIAIEFFEFIRTNTTADDIDNLSTIRKLSFFLYVLPSNSQIVFDDVSNSKSSKKNEKIENNNNATSSFTDSFGNLGTSYGSKSTKNVKFLSFYEKAFTINCKKGKEFYRNLGIGKESLQRIFLDHRKIFNIARFRWAFIDLSNVNYTFSQRNRGIFYQLYENFRSLDSAGQTEREKALLKVMCLREQQAKQENLIDENLTMEHMRSLFSWLHSTSIPAFAFEVLIYNNGEDRFYDDYLHACKSFINGLRIPKSHLLSTFQKIIRTKITEWLKKDKKEIFDFFNKSDFCLKALSTRYDGSSNMNASEEFAYKIGKITGLYIDFKKEAEEEPASLRDILTYSKYDREKLRFIMSTIGRGVNLSNAEEELKVNIKKQISTNMPRQDQEIQDADASKNYSYFFYKGYFDSCGGVK